MDARTESSDATNSPQNDERPLVCSCETSPGKTVFTVRDNPDGWIATDLTVDVER